MTPTTPAVPERVRTVAYFLLLAGSALVLLTQGIAPVWFVEPIADQIVQTAGVVAGVLGLIGGGLGVAYRPTAAVGAHHPYSNGADRLDP